MAIVAAPSVNGTGGDVWWNWTNNYTTSTNSIAANNIWYAWAGNTANIYLNTVTYSTTANTVWQGWQNGPITPAPYRTPEEIQADNDRLQAQREENSRRALAAQQVRAQAEDRAMELLHVLLTDEEMRHYLEHDEIQVRSQHGNLYVIEKRGVHGNIRMVDEHGCRLGRICVAPKMWDEESRTLPYADGWIGQYLMLKHDEDLIIGRGNWSQRGVCQHPDVPILEAARAA